MIVSERCVSWWKLDAILIQNRIGSTSSDAKRAKYDLLWCLRENTFKWGEQQCKYWYYSTCHCLAFFLGPLLQMNRKWIILKLWKDFYLIISKDCNAVAGTNRAITFSKKLGFCHGLSWKNKTKPTKHTTKTRSQTMAHNVFFLFELSFRFHLVLLWIHLVIK